MYDILIKKGTIVDGSGAPAYKADLAIKDGKIAKIAPEIDEDAEEIIFAAGLQVTPGFIDCHSHSDESALFGSDSYNYLEQGVTTQICGQCGTSPAPYAEGNLPELKKNLSEEEFAEVIKMCDTPASFMEAAERAELGCNYAYFVGHGALRARAMGYSDARPTEEQMDCMKDMLTDAMKAGFLGFSSGLVYAPSVYGDRAELTELAKAMAPYGGTYASHIRSEGDRLIEAVDEAISVGEGSGCPVLISHFKVMGDHNEGKSAKLIEMMDEAERRGVTVHADQYPYTAGSAPLISQIPPKFLVGGTAETLKKLADPQIRKQIEYSIFNEADEFDSNIYYAGWDKSLIVGAANTPQYVNMTLAQLAQVTGKTPIDAYCDLLIENEGIAQGVYFTQVPGDMIRLMADRRVFAGSDWSDYETRFDPEKVGGGHPRGTSDMVRRLEVVRDFRLRTMEESVKNLTYDPARALGIENHGLLKEGWDANVVVLDYDDLHARADFTHPFRKNLGIVWVMVNGKIAVKNGVCTGVRAGKVLKKGRN